MSDPIIDALVALTGATLEAINTLSIPPEERLIIIAEGKQFRSGDPWCPWKVPEWYRMPGSERAKIFLQNDWDGSPIYVGTQHKSIKSLPAIPIVNRSDGSYEYLNTDQGVRFIIKVVQTKLQFREALTTPGAHVLYDGHARYGRGPCFGEGGGSKGEMWEEGTGNGRDRPRDALVHPCEDGIFRMGAKYIGVEASEILDHGYTPNLAEATVRPTADECDEELKPYLSSLKGRKIQDINPALIPLMRSEDLDKKFWSYWAYFKKVYQPFVVHKAGWESTLSSPDDIGALTPTCRVFSHLGCSTKKHNYPVVRKQKQWQHEGNGRYAYWTTKPTDFAAGHYWLQHLLTYKEFNAFQPWEKSLNYALEKTNSMLTKDNFSSQIY